MGSGNWSSRAAGCGITRLVRRLQDESTMELPSSVAAGLTGRALADLVSFYGKSVSCINAENIPARAAE